MTFTDWQARRCPACGSTRWSVRCRCPAADQCCGRCGTWSHLAEDGTVVEGRYHHPLRP